MPLSWSDQTGIAKALHRAYPEEERLALGLEELRTRIIALPEFAGPPRPPDEAFLRAILWTWMRIADGGEAA
jgi:FeS assembly protein IscX